MSKKEELPKVPDLKPVRPWDMFNKNKERVLDSIQKERMEICRACPQFIKLTTQCKECGCIMEAKTRLADAFCPLMKWDKVKVQENKIDYK